MASPVMTVAHGGTTYTLDVADLGVGEVTKYTDMFHQLGKTLCALADLDAKIEAADDDLNLSERRAVVVGQRDRLLRDLVIADVISES